MTRQRRAWFGAPFIVLVCLGCGEDADTLVSAQADADAGNVAALAPLEVGFVASADDVTGATTGDASAGQGQLSPPTLGVNGRLLVSSGGLGANLPGLAGGTVPVLATPDSSCLLADAVTAAAASAGQSTLDLAASLGCSWFTDDAVGWTLAYDLGDTAATADGWADFGLRAFDPQAHTDVVIAEPTHHGIENPTAWAAAVAAVIVGERDGALAGLHQCPAGVDAACQCPPPILTVELYRDPFGSGGITADNRDAWFQAVDGAARQLASAADGGPQRMAPGCVFDASQPLGSARDASSMAWFLARAADAKTPLTSVSAMVTVGDSTDAVNFVLWLRALITKSGLTGVLKPGASLNPLPVLPITLTRVQISMDARPAWLREDAVAASTWAGVVLEAMVLRLSGFAVDTLYAGRMAAGMLGENGGQPVVIPADLVWPDDGSARAGQFMPRAWPFGAGPPLGIKIADIFSGAVIAIAEPATTRDGVTAFRVIVRCQHGCLAPATGGGMATLWHTAWLIHLADERVPQAAADSGSSLLVTVSDLPAAVTEVSVLADWLDRRDAIVVPQRVRLTTTVMADQHKIAVPVPTISPAMAAVYLLW